MNDAIDRAIAQLERTSIKNFVVRCKKKGKTRGRPSMGELYLSKALSDEFLKPSVQKEVRQCMKDCLLYGTGLFDTNKALKDKK